MPQLHTDPISASAVLPSPTSLPARKLPPTVAEWATDAAEVAAFCERHDVFDEAELAVALARKHYGNGRMKIGVEYDPGYGEEWLGMDVKVDATVEQVRVALKAFVQEWISRGSTDKLLLIRVDSCFR